MRMGYSHGFNLKMLSQDRVSVANINFSIVNSSLPQRFKCLIVYCFDHSQFTPRHSGTQLSNVTFSTKKVCYL